ncbi:MAG: hypothetical protein ACRCVN_01370 [Spirochaetia bacterium]
MKKVLSLTLVLFFVATNMIWSQEEVKQNRGLGFYIDATSGQLAPTKSGVESRDQLFEGSEVEMGIRYSQNFKSVPWITMGGTLKWVTNPNNAYDGNGDFIGNAPDNSGDIRANVWISLPYIMVLLDSRGLLGAYTSYGHSFGAAGSIAVGADLEIFITGNSWYGNPDRNTGNSLTGAGGAPIYVVDYFGLWVTYSVGIIEGLSFSTSGQVRFNANSWNGWASVEFDPLASLELRWNNTLAYSIDGWSFFAQLRLSAFGLAGASTPAIKNRNNDPQIVFQTIAGVSYAFDFSK